MSIKVKQSLVSSSKYNIKCPHSMNAEYITYHNTYNDAMAQSEINYMNSNNNQVSYHFAVDDKEVVQGLPLNRNGWHCGDGGSGTGNRKSIGVEVCYSKSGGSKYYAAEKLANKFIAQLLHERGWGIDRVKKHQDWSKKYCPHRILSEGRWNATLKDIQNELNKLKGKPTTSSKPTQKPSKPSTKPSTGSLGLVDYMNSKKMNSNYSNRKKLAAKYGIKGYKGTASQNTQLLAKIKGGKPTSDSQIKANLKIDGYMGIETIKAMQRYFGTTVDGVLSKPSLVIRKLQALLKVKVDGYLGKVSITAMQKRFGMKYKDGVISKPSAVIKELQRRLNRGKL